MTKRKKKRLRQRRAALQKKQRIKFPTLTTAMVTTRC